MPDLRSVSSPRRVLSFSNKKRGTIFVSEADSKNSSFGFSGEHGPKTSEVYGFVGSITIVVATGVFLIWAYVPPIWLHSIGIHYYPSRYWALALPTYFLVTVVLALIFYVGLNFMSTPSPNSLNTLFDEYSRRETVSLMSSSAVEREDLPIDPMFDIGISQINDLMFGKKISEN